MAKSYSADRFRQNCKMAEDRKSHSRMGKITITEGGVEKQLGILNPGKASGPDGISPKIPKELSHEIAPLLKVSKLVF